MISSFSSYDYSNEDILVTINCGIKEAIPLHYAAIFSLSELCKWLIEKGCAFGTALHCAQLSYRTFHWPFYSSLENDIYDKTGRELETIDLLSNAGADPNTNYHSTSGELSPLFLAVYDKDLVTTRRLLQKGAIVNDRFVNLLIEHAGNDEAWDDLQNTLEHVKNSSLGEGTRAQALQYALKTQNSGVIRLFLLSARSDKDKHGRNRHSEASLRTAAEYCQVKAVLRLLDDHGVDADAAQENTLLAALYYASMKDQLEVAHVLLQRRASHSKVDWFGKTALHYCVKGEQSRCLSYFLKQGLDVTVTDNENLTVWHLAALENNVEALKILLSDVTSIKSLNELKGSKERFLIFCASQSGFAVVSLLLDVGCSAYDLDLDGCTALVTSWRKGRIVESSSASGFSSLDPSAKTHDGSSTIHYAVMVIVQVLT